MNHTHTYEHRPLIQALEAARRDARIPQHVLGRGIGVVQGTISDWETLLNAPRLDNFIRWAAYFGYDVVLKPMDLSPHDETDDEDPHVQEGL